jgi:hypothetical protein
MTEWNTNDLSLFRHKFPGLEHDFFAINGPNGFQTSETLF